MGNYAIFLIVGNAGFISSTASPYVLALLLSTASARYFPRQYRGFRSLEQGFSGYIALVYLE